eukprot:TRINITY_DN1415_c0_g1_i1.p1 TRINITY_DN1415_c0_g1~~TRINITY_DN1415_c0_g1_i1.p1  ORF type:complete len:182 (+),score=31.50 TRINITY_DN1415_c0_g1_i1:179-724(+)
MRKLKHHEQKLLKKVDIFGWNNTRDQYEHSIISRYKIKNRDDFIKYKKLVDMIKQLKEEILKLDAKDPFREKMTTLLLEKLYEIGLVADKKSLVSADKLGIPAFCRRRLPVVMLNLKYAENMKDAVTFVEQGHIRIGPEVVTDPAFLVSRKVEDYITWVDQSKIREKVLNYNNLLDDYDLL